MLKLIKSIKDNQKKGKQIREYLMNRFEMLKLECLANGDNKLLRGVEIILHTIRKMAY